MSPQPLARRVAALEAAHAIATEETTVVVTHYAAEDGALLSERHVHIGADGKATTHTIVAPPEPQSLPHHHTTEN